MTEVLKTSLASLGLASRKVHIAVIFLLLIITYSNSLFNYYNGDDGIVFINVPAVHGLNMNNVKTIFTSLHNGIEYLPVRDLSYCIDYELWGLNPFGYHLTNLLYYAMACAYLYFLLSNLFAEWVLESRQLALITTLLFAVHPVHVESVAGIAQRKDVLSGLFLFACMYYYLSYLNTYRLSYYMLSVLSACLALLSKTTVIIIPAIIILFDFLQIRGESIFGRKRLFRVAPYALVTALMTILSFVIAKDTGVVYPGSLVSRIPLALVAVFRYLAILVVPYPLSMSHEMAGSKSISEFMPLICLMGIFSIMGVIWKYWKKEPIISFSAAWYLLSVVPVIGLIPTSTVLAERYLFIPSVGFCSLIAWLLYRALYGRACLVFHIVIISIIMTFSVITVRRNAEWENMLTLWTAEHRIHPDSVKVNKILGVTFFQAGRYADAFIYLRHAKDLDPSALDYDYFLALYEYKKGNLEKAFSTLSNLNLDFIRDVRYLYGLIYEAAGNREQAMSQYQKALLCEVGMGFIVKKDIRDSIRRLKGQTQGAS